MIVVSNRKRSKEFKTEPSFITSLAQMAAISGLAFSAMFGMMLVMGFGFIPLFFLPDNLTSGLGAVAVELGLIGLTLLAETFAMRSHAVETQRQMAARVKMQQAGGVEVKPEDASVAEAKVPSFGAFLKRNAVVALLFAPLTLLITYVAFRLLEAIMSPSVEPGTHQNTSLEFLKILLLVP